MMGLHPPSQFCSYSLSRFLTSATAFSAASPFPGSRSLAVGPTVLQQRTRPAAKSRTTPTARGFGWGAAVAEALGGGHPAAGVAADP